MISNSEVDEFIAALDHPFKEEILELRRIVLDAEGSIQEGIKWNSLSFRTSEFFATFHLPSKKGIRLILHFGAKKRSNPTGRSDIADPDSLLAWLGPDRASLEFQSLDDVRAKETAFKDLIREWIRHF